jgi:hypothetical protein
MLRSIHELDMGIILHLKMSQEHERKCLLVFKNSFCSLILSEVTTEENVLNRKRRAADTQGSNRTQTTFKLASTTAACTVWDEVSESWKSNVCQVQSRK